MGNMDMSDERERIELEDDEGNQLSMEILDYLSYEGREYAILTEYVEDPDMESDEPLGIAVMEVVPLDEENEEFVPVDDALGEEVFRVWKTRVFDDDEILEEDE